MLKKSAAAVLVTLASINQEETDKERVKVMERKYEIETDFTAYM
jgi:hypothetical protein